MTHRSSIASWAVAAGIGLLAATPAQAQWVPGGEVSGQTLQAQTNGVTNRVDLTPGGTLRISSPTGATVVDGTWTAGGGQLCMTTAQGSDCWPYTAPFRAGQPVTLVSTCNVTTTWSAAAVNVPLPQGPERGMR
jgi:hypothetical protein